MVIGPTKLAFKGILIFCKIFWKYGWILITLIILSSAMIGSIKEGIEEEDWRIPMKDAGLFLVSADEKVYEGVQDLEFDLPKKIDSLKKIPYYLDFVGYILKNLFIPLWMILFNYIFFYKIFLYLLGDVSKKRRAIIVSISTMVIIQIMVLGIPFRGIFSLGKFVIGVLGG
ncbi:hypothetical protein ES703_110459 [subsurface metagenome]